MYVCDTIPFSFLFSFSFEKLDNDDKKRIIIYRDLVSRVK